VGCAHRQQTSSFRSAPAAFLTRISAALQEAIIKRAPLTKISARLQERAKRVVLRSVIGLWAVIVVTGRFVAYNWFPSLV
jgi:hypothetical protein